MIVIEIPHQMDAEAYEIDEAGLIEEAHKRAEKSGEVYDPDPELEITEAEWARGVLFHDLAGVREFPTIGEALLWATEYAKADQNGCYSHQAFKVEAVVEGLAEDLAARD